MLKGHDCVCLDVGATEGVSPDVGVTDESHCVSLHVNKSHGAWYWWLWRTQSRLVSWCWCHGRLTQRVSRCWVPRKDSRLFCCWCRGTACLLMWVPREGLTLRVSRCGWYRGLTMLDVLHRNIVGVHGKDWHYVSHLSLKQCLSWCGCLSYCTWTECSQCIALVA